MKHHIHALDVQETSGFQIPTFNEVVRNATFINGPPIPDPPPTLDLVSDEQLLFPFMNFTCNGRITRLTFLGWLNDHESSEPFQFDATRLTSWPYFSLWRPRQHQYFEEIQIGPNYHDLQASLRINDLDDQLVKVNFSLTTNVMFSANDILGVTQRYYNDSTLTQPDSINISMAVLGYSETPICYTWQSIPTSCNATMFQEKQPYIAIETGEI